MEQLIIEIIDLKIAELRREIDGKLSAIEHMHEHTHADYALAEHEHEHTHTAAKAAAIAAEGVA